jgi:hypothetical protein
MHGLRTIISNNHRAEARAMIAKAREEGHYVVACWTEPDGHFAGLERFASLAEAEEYRDEAQEDTGDSKTFELYEPTHSQLAIAG